MFNAGRGDNFTPNNNTSKFINHWKGRKGKQSSDFNRPCFI